MTIAIPSAVPATLRAFAAYLRHPRLIQPAGLRAPGAWAAWATMLALHLLVLLAVIGPFLRAWQAAFAVPPPDAFGKLPEGWLLPAAVLAAPLLEELLYRGWLTGRPRALWLLACALAGGALLALVALHIAETAASLAALAVPVAGVAGWFVLRRHRAAPAWFAGAFPAIFALSAAAFALSHLINYPRLSPAVVPMVLPQLWAALTLGFVRMRIGLPASMLLHAIANGLTLVLVLGVR